VALDLQDRSSVLKMAVNKLSEMSVSIYQISQRHSSADCNMKKVPTSQKTLRLNIEHKRTNDE
jgi:hypothetical protein